MRQVQGPMSAAKEILKDRILAYLEEYDCYCTDDETDRKNLAEGLAERLTAKQEPQPKVVIRKVNEKERKILEKLADEWHPDEWHAYSFKSLAKQTEMDVKDVRRACRSLARKGLAVYERVLVDMDGIPAGAGYRASEEGAALISPCDLCQKRASYDYHVDAKGLSDWDKGYDKTTERRVRECEDHYKQSAANPPMKQEALV